MSGLHLESENATAEVACHGAELRSWCVAGTPLLWSPDPAIWADVAPILFPVVGWTRGSRIVVDGEAYPLGLHGFARSLPFDVVEQGDAHVRLVLAASDATRGLYPFAFSLEVEHRLEGASLTTRLHVRNGGSRAMPYACGLHPGFRWPFAGGAAEDYAILFDEAERPDVPVISAGGLFTRGHRPVPLEGRRLALSAGLMAREALCFLDARSRSLRFVHESGAAIVVALENFPHLALWSRPAGGFLSIEAWTGHGDFIDADGEFIRKPSMVHLPPGAGASHAATFSFEAPARDR